MATELRKTGIDVVGDTPWGTHFCLFYETKEDVLDTLVPYWKAGLEGQEFCVWVIAKPLREEDARHALKQAMPDLDRYLADGSIEIVSAEDWYLQGGKFDLERVLGGWHEKLASALARGYTGMRVTGDTVWLQKDDWKDFCEYEDALNLSIANQRLNLLCSYPLAACGAAEILDVARTHQFAVAKRHGSWEVLETPSIKQAKAEIKQLNEELEQRVVERTSQLTAVNEELRTEIRERNRAETALRESETRLRETQADLAHVTRVTTLGELTASLAHEINQPLSGVAINGNTCLRWLAADPPNLDEAREAARRAVRDGTRANEVIARIRALTRKDPPARGRVDINDAIRDVVALAQDELRRSRVVPRMELADDLPPVLGDRVQLQQVVLNLVMNGLEAMTAAGSERRELVITTQAGAVDQVGVAVQDSGVGLDPRNIDQLFEAFYTTKSSGMGMGLSISRTIVASHGGQLWAVPNDGPGATFQFTVPRYDEMR